MQEQIKRGALAVPLLVGGLIGGGVALIFAPRLTRVRQALVAAGDKTRQMLLQRKVKETPKPEKEGIYCDVPEGADICFDEKERT